MKFVLFVLALGLSGAAQATARPLEVSYASCVSDIGIVVDGLPVVINRMPPASISFIVVEADGKPTIKDQTENRLDGAFPESLVAQTYGEKTLHLDANGKASFSQKFRVSGEGYPTHLSVLNCTIK